MHFFVFYKHETEVHYLVGNHLKIIAWFLVTENHLYPLISLLAQLNLSLQKSEWKDITARPLPPKY